MLLISVLYLPFLGAFFISLVPVRHLKFIRLCAFWCGIVEFLLAVGLFLACNFNFFFIQNVVWLEWHLFTNFYYSVGIDVLSLMFILLTNFLAVVVGLLAWGPLTFVKQYVVSFLLVQGFLLQTFCVLDIYLFYIFFEATLVPLFLIVGFWGSRVRKTYAAYLLFLYTLFGSLPLLLGMLLVTFQVSSSDFGTLWLVLFSEKRQVVLWVLFFLGFAIKIPMFPFHSWLPEAHAEAPTAGSSMWSSCY